MSTGLDPVKCYFVWVAGRGSPKKVYETLDRAREAAHAIRAKGRTREILILATHEVLPGRKVLGLKDGQSMNAVRPAEPQ